MTLLTVKRALKVAEKQEALRCTTKDFFELRNDNLKLRALANRLKSQNTLLKK